MEKIVSFSEHEKWTSFNDLVLLVHSRINLIYICHLTLVSNHPSACMEQWPFVLDKGQSPVLAKSVPLIQNKKNSFLFKIIKKNVSAWNYLRYHQPFISKKVNQWSNLCSQADNFTRIANKIIGIKSTAVKRFIKLPLS